MSGERIIIGSFGDLLSTGRQFLNWLAVAMETVIVPDDYWAPELLNVRPVRAVPVGVLDRNEILLIPRMHRTVPISVSWSMPIALASNPNHPQIRVMRGAASCWTCAHRDGPITIWRCAKRDRAIGTAEAFARDLGACPLFEAAPPGRITIHRVPVWWRDSDWPVAGWRYGTGAFDRSKLLDLLDEKEIEPPLRVMPIPPTPREAGGLRRSASPTMAGWLSFLENAFVGLDGLQEFLREARKKEFTASGGV